MITRRKFLATSAMGLWLPTAFGASPIITRRVVLSRTESAPDMLWQTTKVGVFNPTITKTGLPVEWDFGDGSARELTNAPNHTYANTGIKNVGVRLQDAASTLTQISMFLLNLSGPIPEIFIFTNLTRLTLYNNYTLTGNVPNFTVYTALIYVSIQESKLTGYTPSTCALTLTTLNLASNLLPQSAVDQIAADFATNIASRPATGTLNVGGTGNATPSAAGVANFALVAARGWTVTTN